MDDSFAINAVTLPVNASPSLISLGLITDLQKIVIKSTGLLVLFNSYYEPTQVRITNSSSAKIFFTFLTEDDYSFALQYPGYHKFIPLDPDAIASNDVTRARYVVLYAETTATGLITVDAMTYWCYKVDQT